MTALDLVAEVRSADSTISRIRTASWRRWYLGCVLALDLVAPLVILAMSSRYDALTTALAVVWPAVLAVVGVYSSRILAAAGEEYRRVGLALLGLLTLAALGSSLAAAPLAREFLVIAALLVTVALVGRAVVRSWLARQRAAGRHVPKVLLVGGPRDVQEMADLLQRRGSGLGRVVGAVVPEEARGELSLDAPVPVAEGLDHVRSAVELVGADTVLIAGGHLPAEAVRRLAWSLEDVSAELVLAPAVVDVESHRLKVRSAAGLPVLAIARPRFRGMARVWKELVDRLGAAFLLLVLAPALIGLLIAVRVTSPGPSLFRQVRIGRKGKPFTLFKIRTMSTAAEDERLHLLERNEAAGPLFKLRADPRVTPLGRILRKYSLDELPQLFNVLRGDMSLVGPRPPLPAEVALYPDHVRRRLLVKPGLTGLWQVSGRSDLSWEEAVRLDLRYVDNWSLAQDAAILRRTVHAVVRGTGAY